MSTPALLWRRLDTPGHDTCRLRQTGQGWCLEGFAAFLYRDRPAGLHYRVECDSAWRTRRGRVYGWLGEAPVRVTITHPHHGAWRINGCVAAGLDDCIDLDLGFTPATNLIQLRRAAPATGESALITVAWYDPEAATLLRVEQEYVRRAVDTYWYEAPRFGYAAQLRVDAQGFIQEYPGLWEMISRR